MSSKKQQSFFQLGLIIGIAFFLNFLGNIFFTHIDLTEDKRFTLAKPTKDMLNSLEDVVYVEVLLEGEFPAGFKRLQRSVREMLNDLRSESGGLVEYTFTDPNIGTVDNVNQRREEMAKSGIVPTVLRVKDVEGTAEKLIYPYAKIQYQNKTAVVNLLEGDDGRPQEEALNYSISQLEYKFANALHKLSMGVREVVAFTVGHGELDENERKEVVKNLRAYYEVGTFNLDSSTVVPPQVKVLIVAKPRAPFSDRDKFLIDQYIMNGGKVIWLLDRLNVELDSMRRTPNYVARDYDLDLDGMLFKYGARVNPDLVLDLQCSRIPMVIDQVGKQELFKWYYNPIVLPRTDHPMVKSLDGINLMYPSSIDTIKTKTPVKKTILLTTSQYGRIQPNITRLNFEILRYEPDPDKFNKPDIPVAVLLEGEFPSFFENKVTEGMKSMLTEIGQEFQAVSKPTKMLVVSDGDIARPFYNPITGQFFKLGYNPYERYMFANKDFLLNAVEYLKDEDGIIEVRSKDIKLRLMNTAKAEEEKTMWQLLNIVAPILFLIIFGIVYNAMRKRKYAGV
ncbi:MAG: gliding motility-associated ABC transporter substrate-binding protein GldG [Saprospiraceae bacterium]